MEDEPDLDPNFIKLLETQKPEPPQPVRDYMAVGEWSRLSLEAALYDKWIGVFDPALSSAFDAYHVRQGSLEYLALLALRNEAQQVFSSLIQAMPGTGHEKFMALGRPKALVHILGLRSTRPSDRDWDASITAITNGVSEYAPERDGRIKPVLEPASGRSWPSATDLAYELGCAPGTLYNHLQRPGLYPSVAGRIFEYGEQAPIPGSIAAMDETEREALRERMRANGFTPLF